MVHEKTGFGWPDLWKSLHLVQIWLVARPGRLRTPSGPHSASSWTLQEATYPLPRSYVEPVNHLLFSCGLQGSAASRPRGAPSGGRSLQDLAFLLPYRFRDAKIRTREPARLMPNPCDIFRGGPVRRSPAFPRARADLRSPFSRNGDTETLSVCTPNIFFWKTDPPGPFNILKTEF